MRDADYQPIYDQLSTIDGRIAGLISGVQSALTAECLGTYTKVLDAAGYAEFEARQEFGSVAFTNGGAAIATVSTDTKGTGPPTSGPGVAVVLALKSAVINMRGSHLSIWGTAGASVTFSLFIGPSAPAWG